MEPTEDKPIDSESAIATPTYAKKMAHATWNANGLLQHKSELEIFLEEQRVDVCLISETHFTKESYLKIYGFKIYHTIHPSNNARGGAAVIIRANIKHHEEPKFSLESIQASSVSMQCKRYKFVISAIYSPPRHNIKHEEYKEFLHSLGNSFIAGGDFNANHTHWCSRYSSAKGKELLLAGRSLNCEFLSSGSPGYWPTDVNRLPDVINFFVVRGLSANYIKVETCLELSSDHTPVILTLSDSIIYKEPSSSLTNKKTDWDKYSTYLEENILNVPLKTYDQIENEVKEMLKERRKARRNWQKTRDPERKTILNRNVVLNYLYWPVSAPPIRKPDGKWARSNQEKADLHANYLEKIFQPNESQDRYTAELDAPAEVLQEYTPINHISPKEILDEICRLKLKKAPGFDLVTVRMLKELPHKGVMKLAHLFNADLRLRYFPNQWKIAEVITIPKVGKPLNEISSHRPISLLPVISKVFEKLSIMRLKAIMEENQLIPEHQFGFQDKHSTLDQVHRITDLIEIALEKKKVCSAVLLDVSQAFDRVWHKGLVYKLRNMLPKSFSSLLKSYLQDRCFRVRFEDAYSNFRRIAAGVPQSSVLGPILYLLYSADIPNSPGVRVATFADDTAILATGGDSTISTLNYSKILTSLLTGQSVGELSLM
ncbi:reverse transcriptase [Lasius niger]|uniref:Reverse transcriptase n=1 Tax=Lasius niger TaxID=67767 RepID=A0A0J7KC92_LASNI|nr:reverse transcriptase [Lasius niger]